ncbi:hypothetical protein KDL01_22635 [Actinospica durhamensis]|uniref:Condensation domain-containing protein n=1 Tax=Actinospica durhamensis TaxID=1508375 RepID=A0A941ES64_9ACTN|nr:hypothetical protein [Actinospica durhamensis]MBR7836091.1 hypothetical protein [Actinospica durhamensis]
MKRLPMLVGQPPLLATPVGSWPEVAADLRDLTQAQAHEVLASVIERHEALRMVAASAAGDAQFLLDPADVEVHLHDPADAVPATWPQDRPRWFAVLDASARRLVLRVCPSCSDRPGLEILARDLAAAVNAAPPRPAPSLAAVALREADPRNRATLRANAQYYSTLMTQPWTGKPAAQRSGSHRWQQATGAVSAAVTRAFVGHATAVGVSWPNLVRAAFFRAQEVVWSHGEIVVTETHPQRDDDERRRCVGPLSVAVPLVLDLAEALIQSPDDWARSLERRYREALAHLPVDPAAIAPEAAWSTHRRPRYAVEIRDHSILPPPQGPNVAPSSPRTVFEAERGTHGLSFVVADHTARCGPYSLDLLATCLIGTIESYAGLTDTPAIRVLEEASRLRASVGPWACLEDRGGALVAYTPSTPTPTLAESFAAGPGWSS